MKEKISLCVQGNVAHCASGKDDSFEFRLLINYLVIVDRKGFIREMVPAASNEGQQILDKCKESCATLVHLNDDELLVPGFIDCHVHAPQYSYTGTATDKPLLEWLNAYTFPAEAALKDLERATKVYKKLVKRLVSHGTTTAMYFATKDIEPCKALMLQCVEQGQRALIGKVCMDRHAPDL